MEHKRNAENATNVKAYGFWTLMRLMLNGGGGGGPTAVMPWALRTSVAWQMPN